MSYFRSHGRTWYVVPSGCMATSAPIGPDDAACFKFRRAVLAHVRRCGERFCPVSHEYLSVYGGSCEWCGASSSMIILVGRETG